MASSSTSTTSSSSPASAPALSAADGPPPPVNPAGGRGVAPPATASALGQAPSSAPGVTPPATSSALGQAPSSAPGVAPHATASARRAAAPSDPAASASTDSNASKVECPTSPPPSPGARASGASRRRPQQLPLAPAASSPAAARQHTSAPYETGWGGKPRVVPLATGFNLLRPNRHSRFARADSSRGRGGGGGSSSKAATSTLPASYSPKNPWTSPWLPSHQASANSTAAAATGAPTSATSTGGYEGWETAPEPTSSILPATNSSENANSTAAAATGAPTSACPSSHPSLITRFAGHYVSPSSASSVAAASAASAGSSTTAPAYTLFGPNCTQRAAAAGLAPQFPQPDLLPQTGGFPGAVLGQAPQITDARSVLFACPGRQPGGLLCWDCKILRAEVPISPCGHIIFCAECHDLRQRCPCCLVKIE